MKTEKISPTKTSVWVSKFIFEDEYIFDKIINRCKVYHHTFADIDETEFVCDSVSKAQEVASHLYVLGFTPVCNKTQCDECREKSARCDH